MHQDEKYVVFKRADWDRHVVEEIGPFETSALALDDAVVIRTGDVFAHAGLSAYAEMVRIHRELLSRYRTSGDARGRLQVDAEFTTNLERIERYFVDCAQEAADRFARGDVKVPD